MKNSVLCITFLFFMVVINSNVFAQKSNNSKLKATIEGVSSGEISKALLVKNAEIVCSDSKFKIINFTLSVKKDSDIIDMFGTGNLLTLQMQNLINGLNLGNKVIFEKINAKSDDGVMIELPSLVMVLK